MRREYRALRLKQLANTLAAFHAAKKAPRPPRGWLRAVREALGITQLKLARAVHVKQQSIIDFEKAEASDRITLRNLRRLAEAMDCMLVYAIVPKTGTITGLADRSARKEAARRVLSAEHTMALENQASGGTKKLIDTETRRIRKK